MAWHTVPVVWEELVMLKPAHHADALNGYTSVCTGTCVPTSRGPAAVCLRLRLCVCVCVCARRARAGMKDEVDKALSHTPVQKADTPGETVWCGTVQQCSEVQCSAVQCSSVQFRATRNRIAAAARVMVVVVVAAAPTHGRWLRRWQRQRWWW